MWMEIMKFDHIFAVSSDNALPAQPATAYLRRPRRRKLMILTSHDPEPRVRMKKHRDIFGIASSDVSLDALYCPAALQHPPVSLNPPRVPPTHPPQSQHRPASPIFAVPHVAQGAPRPARCNAIDANWRMNGLFSPESNPRRSHHAKQSS